VIRDIIWDFDGTLFDTYPSIVEAFSKALKDSGAEETKENVLKYLKISEGCAVSHFKEQYGLGEAFFNSLNLYKKSIGFEAVKPFPFAEEVCEKLVALGGRNYILTHRGGSTIKILEHHGMLEYFTEIVTKHHGFKRKPDPEAFMYLINKYSIDKSTALVVGDRDFEILGGKAAGVKVCLYNTNNVEITETPDFNVSSLSDLIEIIK
jgi:HAD superfamily hydrolase (TIGR01549 family)